MQNFRSMWSNLCKEHQALVLVLLLALVMGTTFIILVPPWQHYDEPTQFEYAWLVANQTGFPSNGDHDQQMRREVAASMIEHGFFDDLGFKPDLLSGAKQIWIGISQVGSQPLYYWLAALPLRFLKATDVTFQLYVDRIYSLLFMLVTVGAAYGFAVELTSPEHPIRWLLPLSILLLPGFADISSAVNDDVAAIAFFSLFLWAGVRLMKGGFSWMRILALVILSLLCFYTKSTVMIAVGLAAIPILFSIFGKARKRIAWMVVTAGVIIGFMLFFEFGYPRSWYQEAGGTSSNFSVAGQSPLGDKGFKFNLADGNSPSRISQLIPADQNQRDTKTVYTVGAWIWADQPLTVQTPTLHITDRNALRKVDVDQEPKFFTFTEKVGVKERPYKISLSPGPNPAGEEFTVYYDGILLVEGDWDGEIPEMENHSGDSGLIGGEYFTNRIRNSSAEKNGLALRTWVTAALSKVAPGNPNLIIGLIQDPAPLIGYYKSTIKSLLHTFWARFGWAQVTLVGYRPYTILGLFTLAGILGALFAFWRYRSQIRWELFFFLGLALVGIWGAAFLRGVTSFMDGGYYIPVARYAYPVIIPTMLVLNIGWLEIMHWVERFFKIQQRYQIWVLITLFIMLDIISFYTIYSFYHA